jgi:aminocarboxymuconate-semialdehyde decarboxylase
VSDKHTPLGSKKPCGFEAMPQATVAAAAFCCAPSDAHAGGTARAPRPISIDIHCHVHVERADKMVAPYRRSGQEPILDHASPTTIAQNRASLGAVRDKLNALAPRLLDMNKLGIDLQVLSPSPFQYFYWAEPEVAFDASRCINDSIAHQVSLGEERFVGLCTVPLQHTEFAVQELVRAVRVLGLKGVEIGTVVGSEELSAARLKPFFAKAEELDAFIFIHPNGFADGRRMASHNLINLVGNPLETTLAASQLIFSGTMREMPGLKLCLAHGGGFLPMYSGRMEHAYTVRPDCRHSIDQPPSRYLRQFYFDTVVYDPAQLEFLVAKFGADRLLMGTDYPYDMGEPDPIGLITHSKALTDSDKAAILGGNAARLLGLDVDHVLRLAELHATKP